MAVDPTWTDVGTFWVSFAAAGASTLIAAVAIFLTINANSSNRKRTAADDLERRRGRRESFAVDLLQWIDSGMLHFVTARDLISGDPQYVAAGNALEARSRVLGEASAPHFLATMREAADIMREVPKEQRVERAILVNGLVKLNVENWVEDPDTPLPKPTEWLTSWLLEPANLRE